MVDPLVRGELRAGRRRVRTAGIRDNLIRDRVAHAVLFAGVAQQANGSRVEFLRRFLLAVNGVLIHLHGTGARATGGVGLHFRIHRHQGVVFAVHVEVEAEVIDVLVGGADNIMVDQRPVAGILFGAGVVHGLRHHAFDGFNPGGAGVDTDGAVVVEHPVKDIIIVPDGTDPAYHQFPAFGTDVGLAHFQVLIFRPGIAFEYGDRAWNRGRFAGVIGDGFIQQYRIRWRVLAAHNRRGQGAHTVIAGVEVGFEIPADVRVAVGDDHPAEGTFIHHLAFCAVIVVGHRREDWPDARVKAQVEIPVLPVNGIPGNGVVFALWFHNIQRFHRRGVAVAAIIRTGFHRNRDHRAFLNFDNFLRFKVDHRHQVFNRVRPVVAVAGIEITDHLQQTRILLQAIFAIKIANGERGGDHFAWIGNTVLFQHLSEFAAGVDDVLHADKIIEQYHPVGAFNWRPGEDFFVLQIDDGFNHVFAIQHHHIGGAR